MVLDETLNWISDLDPIFKVTVWVVGGVGAGGVGTVTMMLFLVKLNLLILQTTISVKVKE